MMSGELRGQRPAALQVHSEKESDTAVDTDQSSGRHNITKTETNTSVADTFSLPREIVFVAVICLAQLFTRMCPEIFPGRYSP